MQANSSKDINSKAAALAAAKAAAVAKANKIKAASKPETAAVESPVAAQVEQPAKVEQVEAKVEATAAVEKKQVGGGLEAWREAQRKARMEREQRVQTIQHDIKDIKAKGAKMTDDDKAKLAALTADLAAAKGAVTGKAKAVKLLNDAIEALAAIDGEASKHNITGFETGDGRTNDLTDVIAAFRGSLHIVIKHIEDSSWTRKPVGFAAKPKVAKVEITIGTKVRISDKAKETYAEVLDTEADYTVTKIVGNKAVIIGDGAKQLVPLAHLTA